MFRLGGQRELFPRIRCSTKCIVQAGPRATLRRGRVHCVSLSTRCARSTCRLDIVGYTMICVDMLWYTMICVGILWWICAGESAANAAAAAATTCRSTLSMAPRSSATSRTSLTWTSLTWRGLSVFSSNTVRLIQAGHTRRRLLLHPA